jgi:PDZ domain-containing protein
MGAGATLQGIRIRVGPSWLIVAPALLWAIAMVYVPILGGFLDTAGVWQVTGIVALLVAASLLLHAVAHVVAARCLGSPSPAGIPLYLFGDAAQAWPAAASPWREVALGASGPLASLALAGTGYLLWNAQLNPLLNVAAPFFGLFNACVAVLNLAPGYPFDGARLVRAVTSGAFGGLTASRVAAGMGYAIAAGLAGWGAYQLAQHVRFGTETGGISLALAAVALLGLRAAPPWPRELVEAHRGTGLRRATWLLPLAGLLVIGMLAASASILPVTSGIEMPGVALSVEPMVEVPAAYRHTHSGTFILTSVIQQTPITLGEWAYGKLSPQVRLLPPQEIVPPGTTLQQQARAGFRMLDESEMAATVAGLRLAGFDVPAVGKGVLVDSILAVSPSHGLLLPGDIIVALDGQPTRDMKDLLGQIAAARPSGAVQLEVERGSGRQSLVTSLLPPAGPGAAPRLGITAEPVGLTYALPFSVTIVPQKIVGGPSAGLMFALTVCNSVSAADLTGGRRIAGTGTIDADGVVGPIGGVEEKVVAAEDAGAAYFLAPPANYPAALAAAHRIRVVKVSSAAEAVAFLRSLPAPQTP